jgi:signal transduction histidine kinase
VLNKQQAINRLERERLLQDKRMAERLLQLYILIAGSVFLAILAFVLYRANRTKQEANRLLEERRVELLRLNAAKDRLFAIIGHDLRGPFTGLKGFLSLLEEESMPEKEQRETVRKLHVAVDGIYTVLDNLLNWSRSQMEGIETKPERFPLHTLAGERIDLLHGLSSSKGVVITNEISPEDTTFADRNQIGIVLQNVVNNAIKYSRPGGQVAIGSLRRQDHVDVWVQDEGVGMTAEQVSALFLPEQRVTHPGTAGERGSGLGLLVCKDFVERNGGHLSVSSEPGKGTCLTVTLRTS